MKVNGRQAGLGIYFDIKYRFVIIEFVIIFDVTDFDIMGICQSVLLLLNNFAVGAVVVVVIIVGTRIQKLSSFFLFDISHRLSKRCGRLAVNVYDS